MEERKTIGLVALQERVKQALEDAFFDQLLVAQERRKSGCLVGSDLVEVS
ncbi:MAG: hypothetical protein IIT74_04095 [Bacteroidales bacterium]|nr:hypothetical protein [Bacteroidales bacterium]